MRTSIRLYGLLLFTLIALDACGDCPAPPKDPPTLRSGMYAGGWRGNGSPGARGRVGSAVIDREAGTATFTFERDGKEIVEVWKFAKETFPNP